MTPYYKAPNLPKCIDDCPDGYTESGNDCVFTQFCHATCETCAVKNDAAQCLTCSSTVTGFTYTAWPTGQTVGSCAVPATNNAQLILTVNKNTILGTS